MRQALQKLPRPAAPQALQARVLLELDAIDREQAAAPALPVLAAPRWSRLRAFFRGAAVMVPAGATALATAKDGPAARAASVVKRVDDRITEHVAALARAYAAAGTARAAEASLDDAALRSVESVGESLESMTKAIVEEV